MDKKESHKLNDITKECQESPEFISLKQSISKTTDLVIITLRFHLYIEFLLEKFLINCIPNGYKIIEYGRLTFNQKLILVDSFNIVAPEFIQSFKNINKLRNSLSHELSKEISLSDIDKIGTPLGKKYQILKKNKKSLDLLMISLYSRPIGYLLTHINELENNLN